MKTITTPSEMAAWSAHAITQPKTIALIPTMGDLHQGHLSLIRLARQHADLTILSLFVNPTQFGPGEDYNTYTRNLQRDTQHCQQENIDILFTPTATNIYHPDHSTHIHENQLALPLCGASRPQHFNGVLTIITKLLNLTRPHIALFGQKDAQQLRLIKRLIRDHNIPVKIISGPTIRESDGLALSSRNTHLTPQQRLQAPCLHQALQHAHTLTQQGQRNPKTILNAVKKHIAQHPLATLDYAELLDDQTLAPITTLQKPALLALAVHFGKTRLIDNQTLTPH